ncbi:MAG: hypothetical protein AAFR63_05155 [Cyanobacteria bacterium J06631_6]
MSKGLLQCDRLTAKYSDVNFIIGNFFYFLIGYMNIDPLTLEAEFAVSKLKLHLDRYPENSRELAIKNYEDFLALAQAYKKLSEEYELLQSEYAEFIELLVTAPECNLSSIKLDN